MYTRNRAILELRALNYDVPESLEDTMFKKIKGNESTKDIIAQKVLDMADILDRNLDTSSDAVNLIWKLSRHRILSPLTGEDWEWCIHDCDDMYAQNKRDGRVFKRRDGSCYFIDGRIFVEEGLMVSYSNKESLVEIESFPFTPMTQHFLVDVDGNIIKELKDYNEGL